MTESYYLLVATFLPLLVSPVAYVTSKKKWKQCNYMVLFWDTCYLHIVIIYCFVYSSGGKKSLMIESYTWSQFGNFGLRIDGLSLPFAIIINILCTVLTLYSKPYMLHKIKESFEENFSNREGNSHSVQAVTTSNAGGNEMESVTISGSNEEQYVNHHMGLYFALYLDFLNGDARNGTCN